MCMNQVATLSFLRTHPPLHLVLYLLQIWSNSHSFSHTDAHMADLHNDILHIQICSKTPASAEHILSSFISSPYMMQWLQIDSRCFNHQNFTIIDTYIYKYGTQHNEYLSITLHILLQKYLTTIVAKRQLRLETLILYISCPMIWAIYCKKLSGVLC